MAQNNSNKSTSNRGFASMDEERQREIASQGGRAAHEAGTAHEFTSEEAREAGRKGGEAVSRDREHMAAIGAEGGRSSRGGGHTGGGSSGSNSQRAGASGGSSPRGGSSEQHPEAGAPSHKNE